MAARRSGSTRTSRRRHPGDDLGDDRVRVLRAGVVGGDDDLVGQATGDLAHDRALAAVAVPARAEDDDDAPAREVARGVQDRLERAGLVRVVDEHCEPLALLDGLQAPGDRCGRAQRRRDGGVLDAERPGDGDGRERVGDVEAPAQRGAQVQPRAPATDDGEVRALEARAHVDGAHVGLALDGHRRDVHLGGQARAPGVVDVDDPHPRAGLEQPALGEEVLLHGRVEVEMVLAEVREHRDGPVDRVRAVQLQRVAGDLHRARGVAAVGHLGERGLEVDGLRRRAGEGPLAARDDALHGPQQRGATAGALQQLADEERGGRLAARPGDADHVQPGAGIAVEPRGDGRHRGADVVDLRPRARRARAGGRRPAPRRRWRSPRARSRARHA